MKNTIVTICDKNCYWGAILLVGSFRKNNMKEDIVICSYDLDEEINSYLEQFENTTVLRLKRPSNANPTTFKAEAMLRIDSELITWMDSDCIVTGNISDLLAKDSEFRFRLRSVAEMKGFPYFGNPRTGGISDEVKKVWQKDINDLEKSSVDSIGSACCFTINEKYKPFLEVWKEKMLKILPATNTGVTNIQLGAYAQLDESVLNACVAFSSTAPKVETYLGNLYPERHIMHFIGKRKPWSGWNPRSFPYFNIVMDILDWIESNYKLPPRPESLQRSQYSKINLRIKKDRIIEILKRQVKKLIRKKV